MEAPPGTQEGALPPGELPGPMGRYLYNANDIRHNFGVIQFNRILVSLVAGIVTGVLGVTGVKGFANYAAAHVVLSAALLAKSGLRPQRYFASWHAVATGGVASSTELLTFILFWTLAHNMVYLF